MSTLGLFIIGAIVTLVVLCALALLIVGAVLDGRAQRERDDSPRPLDKGAIAPAR